MKCLASPPLMASPSIFSSEQSSMGSFERETMISCESADMDRNGSGFIIVEGNRATIDSNCKISLHQSELLGEKSFVGAFVSNHDDHRKDDKYSGSGDIGRIEREVEHECVESKGSDKDSSKSDHLIDSEHDAGSDIENAECF